MNSKPPDSSEHSRTDDDSLVELASLSTETEAELVTQELARHGLEAKTAGGFISGFKAAARADVKVFVQAADLDKARSCLAQLRRENKAIDWTQVDVGDKENQDPQP